MAKISAEKLAELWLNVRETYGHNGTDPDNLNSDEDMPDEYEVPKNFPLPIECLLPDILPCGHNQGTFHSSYDYACCKVCSKEVYEHKAE